MTDTTTDFFDGLSEGTGAPTGLLKTPGDVIHGVITKMFKKDHIPFGAKEPEKRSDNTIRQELVIVVQTALRNWAGVVKVPKVDPTDPNSPEKAPAEDDGLRAVYVPESSNIQFAIGRAVSAARQEAGKDVPFGVGGTFGVKIANLKDTGKGNPLKEHEAVYTPPSAGDAFLASAPAGPAEAQQAPAQTPPPAQPAPAAAPAPQQDPWATPAAPAQSAPAAAPAQQDPWATPGASASTEQPPF